MICGARRDADPEAVTCNVALGGGKAKCACGVAVQEALKVEETRVARVQDSARSEGDAA